MKATSHTRSPFPARIILALPLVFFATHSDGQETFLYTGPTGVQSWEDAANWTGGSCVYSTYPGEAPEPGTRDSADLLGARSEHLELVIAADLELDNLILGSTHPALVRTFVSGATAATLTVDEIQSAGSTLSLNVVLADILLDGDLDVTGTNSLSIAGDLINDDPNPSAFREVINDTNQLLDVRGDVLLSNNAADYGHVFFRNAGTSVTRIFGEITDGDCAGGRVSYAKGDFEIHSDSSYTGITQLGQNSPDVSSTHTIYTDRPFGYGRLVAYGGTALKTIRAASGEGPRTLDNDIQLARELNFEGSEDITLNGTVYQSSGRSLINNVSLTASLTINGDIYASDTTDIREWRFDGTGTTIVNGIIDDSLGHPEVTDAELGKNGSGRLILTNPDVAAYGGPTHIREGVLQLGNGGMPVNLNGNEVSGDAVLEINHAGALDFDAILTDGVALHHIGPGQTTLNHVSTGDGDVVVSSGTLCVNAGDGLTSGTGSGPVSVTGGTLAGNGHVGGAVSISPGATVAPGVSVGTLSVAEMTLPLGATLEIGIKDMNPFGFDSLLVAGDLTLGGSLDVAMLEPFQLAPGDAAQIVDVGGTLTGVFDGLPEGSLVSSFGADLFITYAGGDGNDVYLYSPSEDNADFDSDSDIDIADLMILQRGFGLTGQTDNSGGDANGDGLVDQDDLTVWRTQFTGSPAPTAKASPVPEPGFSALATAALILTISP